MNYKFNNFNNYYQFNYLDYPILFKNFTNFHLILLIFGSKLS